MQFIMGPQDADGRRRQRQITTRRAIEAAAWQLLNAKGFQATTVDEIVNEVGISQRTFFRYFDSKEAVLFGDWRWQVDDLARRIEKADPRLTPLHAVRTAVMSLADGMDRDRRVVIQRASLAQSSTTVGNYYRQVIQPAWEQAVAEAVAARVGSDLDVDPLPRTIAGAAIGALNAALAIWVVGDCSELLPDLTARAFQVLDGCVDHVAPAEPTPADAVAPVRV
jgi:AcrR family transcriptional regulator